MTRVARDPVAVLTESAHMLAFRATAALYEEQPGLWKLGERGRARTLEDFGHHFDALATLDTGLFDDYVKYCEGLFDNHGFPRAWLADAWRIMAEIIEQELPAGVAARALKVLLAGSHVAEQNPGRDRA